MTPITSKVPTSNLVVSMFRNLHVVFDLSKLVQTDLEYMSIFVKKHDRYMKSITIKQTKSSRAVQSSSSDPKVFVYTNKLLLSKFFHVIAKLLRMQPEIESVTLTDVSCLNPE